MKYKKMRVPDTVAKLVCSLHPEIKKKIKAGLKIIIENPQEGKALKNDLAGLNSLRVGKFRIVYAIQDKEIAIVAIGPRKNIYEETVNLIRKKSTTKNAVIIERSKK